MINQQAAVVHRVNETLLEHDNDIDSSKKMSEFGYERESMRLFLRAVRKKLSRDGYTFEFDPDDTDFLDGCLGGTSSDLKLLINQNTKAA